MGCSLDLLPTLRKLLRRMQMQRRPLASGADATLSWVQLKTCKSTYQRNCTILLLPLLSTSLPWTVWMARTLKGCLPPSITFASKRSNVLPLRIFLGRSSETPSLASLLSARSQKSRPSTVNLSWITKKNTLLTYASLKDADLRFNPLSLQGHDPVHKHVIFVTVGNVRLRDHATFTPESTFVSELLGRV